MQRGRLRRSSELGEFRERGTFCTSGGRRNLESFGREAHSVTYILCTYQASLVSNVSRDRACETRPRSCGLVSRLVLQGLAARRNSSKYSLIIYGCAGAYEYAGSGPYYKVYRRPRGISTTAPGHKHHSQKISQIIKTIWKQFGRFQKMLPVTNDSAFEYVFSM